MHASMSTAAVREAYRSTSEQLRAAQQGLFLGASGQELAANVAERPARVGDGVGSGRDLQRQGATFRWSDVSDSPAPVSHACGGSTGQASGPLVRVRVSAGLRRTGDGRRAAAAGNSGLVRGRFSRRPGAGKPDGRLHRRCPDGPI